MDEVIQCPRCELRFTSRSELQEHLALDHPEAREEEQPPEPPG